MQAKKDNGHEDQTRTDLEDYDEDDDDDGHDTESAKDAKMNNFDEESDEEMPNGFADDPNMELVAEEDWDEYINYRQFQ